MVSGEELKKYIEHVSQNILGLAEKIRQGSGTTFEIHQKTTIESPTGVKHGAYTLLLSDDENIINDFLEDYLAWLKTKEVGKRLY